MAIPKNGKNVQRMTRFTGQMKYRNCKPSIEPYESPAQPPATPILDITRTRKIPENLAATQTHLHHSTTACKPEDGSAWVTWNSSNSGRIERRIKENYPKPSICSRNPNGPAWIQQRTGVIQAKSPMSAATGDGSTREGEAVTLSRWRSAGVRLYQRRGKTATCFGEILDQLMGGPHRYTDLAAW